MIRHGRISRINIFVAGEAQVNATYSGRPFNAFIQKLGNADPWHQSWSTKLLPYLIVVNLFYALDAHVVEDIAEEALMLLKYIAAELGEVELAVELEML